MAVMMVMTWPGVSIDQYEAVRKAVDWDNKLPAGGILHLCAHDGKDLRITDIWESPEAFQTFTETRLMPGVQQAGVTAEPQVEVMPAHNVFTPGIK